MRPVRCKGLSIGILVDQAKTGLVLQGPLRDIGKRTVYVRLHTAWSPLCMVQIPHLPTGRAGYGDDVIVPKHRLPLLARALRPQGNMGRLGRNEHGIRLHISYRRMLQQMPHVLLAVESVITGVDFHRPDCAMKSRQSNSPSKGLTLFFQSATLRLVSNETRHQTDLNTVRASVLRWIEDVVIGLNLCPFARPVFERDALRVVTSDAQTEEALLEDLIYELKRIALSPPEVIATTVVAAPYVLHEFGEYNAFIAAVEATIADFDLEGVIQLATFHPRYQFEGTDADALSNYTNRSPVPLFHFLREDDVSDAVATHPDTLKIPERNIATLEALGVQRVSQLMKECIPGSPKGEQ